MTMTYSILTSATLVSLIFSGLLSRAGRSVPVVLGGSPIGTSNCSTS